MSRQDAQWMPMHIGPYLADTMHLRTVEHGAYFLLLMHYWTKGPLADDDRKLAGIARMNPKEWAQHGPVLREFFTVDGNGLLHQKRADAELAKAASISSKRADAARASHEQRSKQTTSKQDANAPAIAEQMHTHARVTRARGYLNLNQVDALEVEEEVALRDAIARELGALCHMSESQIKRSGKHIDQWLARGATRTLLRGVVEPIVTRPNAKSITTFAYFEPAVTEALCQAPVEVIPESAASLPDALVLARRQWVVAMERWQADGCQGESPRRPVIEDIQPGEIAA